MQSPARRVATSLAPPIQVILCGAAGAEVIYRPTRMPCALTYVMDAELKQETAR